MNITFIIFFRCLYFKGRVLGHQVREAGKTRVEETGHSLDWPPSKPPGVQGTELNGLAKCRHKLPTGGLHSLEREAVRDSLLQKERHKNYHMTQQAQSWVYAWRKL